MRNGFVGRPALVLGLVVSLLGVAQAGAQPPAQPQSVVKAPKVTGFTFTYPASLKRYPGLVRELEDRKAKAYALYAKDFVAFDPSRDHAELQETAVWTVDTVLPGLVVLKGDRSSYSGGAHGYGFSDALIWDSKANKVLRFDGLFTDPAAAKTLITPFYCKALDEARRDVRSEPTPKDDIFGKCPDLYKEALVSPTTIVGGKYGRIAITLAPYVAGPYSEGEYGLSIYVPDGLKALVKPQYRALFPS